MISEENLRNLYEGIISGSSLTTKELNSFGFNSKDLKELIERGNLERVKRGEYSFLTVDELFRYGKKLISQKEYSKATQCFEKCHELDPSHPGVCFQLFLRSIERKDYQKAFEYFEILFQTENPYYGIDNNFFLYLLNMITDIPEKHREYARYLKFEDIAVKDQDKRYRDKQAQNRVRNLVLQRNFPQALKYLNQEIAEQGSQTLQNMLIKTLIHQALEAESISRNKLLTLSKTKQYQEIISHLEEKEERYNLGIVDSYILMLAEDIVSMKETREIPVIEVLQARTVFEAIEGRNYQLALELSNEHNQKRNINNSENTLNILLSDACETIRNILFPKSSQPSVAKTEESSEVSASETLPLEKYPTAPSSNETSITSNKTVFSIDEFTSVATFPEIIKYLMNQDLENAFRTLRNYLKHIGKKDYEFLIISLIKISILEGDIAFTRPMTALDYLSRDNFKFTLSEYIQEFYITLSQNKFEEARIYLEIISKSEKLGQQCILTENLIKVLSQTEKMVNYKRNNSMLDNVEKALAESTRVSTQPSHQTSQQNAQVASQITIDAREESQSNNSQNYQPITPKDNSANNIESFLEAKYRELLTHKGMILLNPMDEESHKRIKEIARQYPYMVAFCIGSGESTQMVLRYYKKEDEYIDIKGLIKQGNEAYIARDYNACIIAYQKLLNVLSAPKAFVYSKLGLCYLKTKRTELAINFLTVATELSKDEDGYFDFTNLINKVRRNSETERKPSFKMDINEFQTEESDNYGIENIDEIISYVSETGEEVENACIQLGLNPEKRSLVKLIYAREYYSLGDYAKGDEFLRQVEAGDKTPYVLKILDEIRKNKHLYKNRNHVKRLILTEKPKN